MGHTRAPSASGTGQSVPNTAGLPLGSRIFLLRLDIQAAAPPCAACCAFKRKLPHGGKPQWTVGPSRPALAPDAKGQGASPVGQHADGGGAPQRGFRGPEGGQRVRCSGMVRFLWIQLRMIVNSFKENGGAVGLPMRPGRRACGGPWRARKRRRRRTSSAGSAPPGG